MTKQRTLLVIKPDATARHLIGEILRRIESAGFHISALKMLRLSRDEAREFYKMHREKSFFDPLVEYIISGTCVAVVLEDDNAIKKLRNFVGPTDPAEAKTGTIRHDFGETTRRNSVHASDCPESAEREIKFFFGNLFD